MTRNEIAAEFMRHLCECEHHGYDQNERWGNKDRGICYVECQGVRGVFYKGDRDCSSAVIDAWNEALKGSAHEGALKAASYTGNITSVFVGSGLFSQEPMTFIAQAGDIYYKSGHVAMCISAQPDLMGEFSLNENGDITGGTSGDQTGKESAVKAYRNEGWEYILHYVGEQTQEPTTWATDVPDCLCYSVDDIAQEVIAGKWGNNPERKQRLEAAGYDYATIQKRVNELC